MSTKKALLGMTLAELKQVATELGLPSYTAGQIADWLYKKQVRSIDAMTNLSKAARESLAAHYEVGVSLPIQCKVSTDGSKKYLFSLGENRFVETVFIPEKERATLCVSSQIGCKMNCRFCATGKQGFAGQLTVKDILNQVQSIDETALLTNVVFMGMGEPMDNAEAIGKAVEILTAPYGYRWSHKRITLSSVGILPALQHFLNQHQCHVAISLHAADSLTRQQLVPAEKAYPIADTIAWLRQGDWGYNRKLSFEYTLLEGVNDTEDQAIRLGKLLRGLHCHINLIPFHPIPGTSLRPTPPEGIERFKQWLEERQLSVTVRRSRGQDIEAACGMLSTQKKNTA